MLQQSIGSFIGYESYKSVQVLFHSIYTYIFILVCFASFAARVQFGAALGAARGSFVRAAGAARGGKSDVGINLRAAGAARGERYPGGGLLFFCLRTYAA